MVPEVLGFRGIRRFLGCRRLPSVLAVPVVRPVLGLRGSEPPIGRLGLGLLAVPDRRLCLVDRLIPEVPEVPVVQRCLEILAGQVLPGCLVVPGLRRVLVCRAGIVCTAGSRTPCR